MTTTGILTPPDPNARSLTSIGFQYGNRGVSRTEKNGSIIVLADRFEGKRLNSPNDASA